jgi:hypothetical protein
MGEFADMAIEAMENQEAIFDLYGMEEDYDDDPNTYLFYRSPKRRIVCKYCGKKGFHWKQFDGKWRLADKEGELHSCLPNNKEEKPEPEHPPLETWVVANKNNQMWHFSTQEMAEEWCHYLEAANKKGSPYRVAFLREVLDFS